jgi:type III pantothenate kinase
MILLFDIGNTNIHVSKVIDNIIHEQYRIKTSNQLTQDELYQKIKHYIDQKVEGVSISSVVPSVSNIVYDMVKSYFHIEPLVIKAGIKTGLMIKTDHPQEVGADLICASVFVKGKGHQVIVDLGTAIKYIYVHDYTLKGVIITPGIDISIKALVGGTALLPDIHIEVPNTVLGTNTIHCMQSGMTYGIAAQIEGLLSRMQEEVKVPFEVVLTGGRAAMISPILRFPHTLDEHVVLKGLYDIHKRNEAA